MEFILFFCRNYGLRIIYNVKLLSFKADSGTLYSITFASVLLCIIPTVLFYLFAQEKVEKGISTGAFKG